MKSNAIFYVRSINYFSGEQPPAVIILKSQGLPWPTKNWTAFSNIPRKFTALPVQFTQG